MGYWAKDGAYVYDEDDIKVREAMNETQGQAYERQQRGVAQAKEYEEEQKRRAQMQKDAVATSRREHREEQRQLGEQRRKIWEQAENEREREENLRKYGVEINLKNPKNLSERSLRASLWLHKSLWTTLVNQINGKIQKYDELRTRFISAKTEKEKEAIVFEMEKLVKNEIKKIESENKTRR